MKPTEVLSQEHRVIERVLDCLDRFVDLSEAQGWANWATAAQILDFLRTFADRCHHAKEEEQLFPTLEKHGFSKTLGPTAVMRSEHEQGREFMAAMSDAVERGPGDSASALQQFAQAARGYSALLRAHIQKEDHCLFPMAEQTLSEREKSDMLRQFADTEHRPELSGKHEKYVRIADDLARQLGVRGVGELAMKMPCCGHA